MNVLITSVAKILYNSQNDYAIVLRTMLMHTCNIFC